MNLLTAVRTGIKRATWSIKEAAFYVHNLDPFDFSGDFNPCSTLSQDKTYYWLLKEEDKENLKPVTVADGVRRYSPGTIMRHMDDKGHPFNKQVLKAYIKYGPKTGPSESSEEVWLIFRKAAKLIWEMYPDARTKTVAASLESLRNHLKGFDLPAYGEDAIRKHIADLNPNKKVGRPKKGAPVEIDLASIAKKLI